MSRREQLCLSCGLCCDGTIFSNVILEQGDRAAQLATLGLPLATSRGRLKFPQPCAAFDGCRCCIYEHRPAYCRQFECLLFKRVAAGELDASKAGRIIRLTKTKVAKAHRLLQKLGDVDEGVALAARFRRTSKRLAQVDLKEGEAKLFSELTQVVHSLNLILAESFYPAGRSLSKPSSGI